MEKRLKAGAGEAGVTEASASRLFFLQANVAVNSRMHSDLNLMFMVVLILFEAAKYVIDIMCISPEG